MPQLSVSILGPLEVRSGGFVVPVNGKPAVVLAVLLLRSGESVSTDALIDALWGDDPPETARAALQVHVSKLRKILDGVGGKGVLRTIPNGYVLEIDPDDVDLGAFDRAVLEAREALAEPDAARARSVLADALALWRGQPLEGIDVPGVLEGVAGLEDRRREALVLRCEADLALGRHREILPELETLRVLHPLDEHITELAALALHRSGRSGEALQAIGALRRALSEELGMDPGATVVKLESQLLASDPALAAPAEDAEPTSGEHRKMVTAVVCRLRFDDEDLEARRRALDTLTHAAAEIIEPLDGDLRSGAGSSVVATFGVRVMHEDDVVRAVRAALAIRVETERSGRAIATGIATGEALVERAGADWNLLTTDPLEDADRLAAAATIGEILLAPAAYRLASDAIEIAPDQMVPGGAGIDAHRVTGLADAAPHMGQAPLIGREDELATLLRGFDRTLRDKSPSMVTVVGAPGVGKSKLVASFLQQLPEGTPSVVGRCLPYGRDITYWPAAEVIRQLAGVTPADSARIARDKLASLLQADDDDGYLTSQLEVVLGLGEASPAPDELQWAIRRSLELAAAQVPLVVVWDDLQFAEEAMLDLVGYLAASARDVPLFMVGLARPELVERRSGWIDRAGAIDVRLRPLDHEAAGELLEQLAGAPLSDAAVARIHTAGGGNPLFLRELLTMLIADERLVLEDGGWSAVDDLATIDLPPSVQQLLAARLDRLPTTERLVLEAAAVMGEEFTESDVIALRSDLGEESVTQTLAALERRDLVQLDRFVRGSGRVFRFRHLMVRDAAYRGIPKEMRARDHERFGEVLEAQVGERLSEVEEIVGYHLETGLELLREVGAPGEVLDGLGRRAAGRLASAGRRAMLRDDTAAAAGSFARALACLPPGDLGRVELWWRSAHVLVELGRFSEAENAVQAGLAEAARAGDDVGRWRLLVERENLRWYRTTEDGSLTAIREAATVAIKELEAAGDRVGLARAERLLSDVLGWEGQMTEALEAARRGQAHAIATKELWDRATAGTLHGVAPLDIVIDDARTHLRTNGWTRPETTCKLGAALALKGEADEARTVLDEGLALARDVGIDLRIADALMINGYARIYLGDPEGAVEALDEAVSTLEAIGEAGMRSTATAFLAEALYRSGRFEAAWQATKNAERIGTDDDRVTQSTWRRVRAKLLARQGEWGEAVELARSATAIADHTEMLSLCGEAHADLALILALAGDNESSEREAAIAIDLFERKGAAAGVAGVVAASDRS